MIIKEIEGGDDCWLIEEGENFIMNSMCAHEFK